MLRPLLVLSLTVPLIVATAAEPKAKAGPVPIDPVKMAAVNNFERGLRLLDTAINDKEREEATALITGAAEAGYPDAQFFLGLVNERSQAPKAREWFAKAAATGHVRAATKLAAMYDEGRGGEADREQALKWHRVAAEGGNAESAFKVARAKETGGDANPAEAMKMYQKAALAGDSEANMRLGDLYFTGDGGERNLPEAFKYYRNAAQLKNPKAYFKMGYCYERGHGIGQSNQEAVRWYQRGVDAGDLNSIANMARFYENGVGVDKDLEKAAELYKIGAEQGEPFSQISLGSLYRSGSGVKKDLMEAYKWTSMATSRGFGQEILVLLEKEMTAEQLKEAKKRVSDASSGKK
jgi:hypothetical protein